LIGVTHTPRLIKPAPKLFQFHFHFHAHVALRIAVEFVFLKRHIALRLLGMLAFMPMPKATVHEHNRFFTGKLSPTYLAIFSQEACNASLVHAMPSARRLPA
jgi:hypothetical protein